MAKKKLPNKPDKTNWVEQAGHLPSYIRRIAEHLHGQGMTAGVAIATAVNTVKRWAAGGPAREGGKGKVSAKTQALAAKALAEWESKKARGGKGKLKEAPDYAGARAWAQGRLVVLDGVLAGDLRNPNAMQRGMLRQLTEAQTPWEQRRELEVEREFALFVLEATADLPLSLREDADGVEVDDGLLVGPGARGEPVTHLQARLGELGHETSVDGTFGNKTRASLEAFQEAAGLKRTGVVDPDTVAALRKAKQAAVEAQDAPEAEEPKVEAKPKREHRPTPRRREVAPPPAVLRRSSSYRRDPHVKAVQGVLLGGGYDVGAAGADGRFGTATERAVKRFQRDHGLRADGVVGRHTRRMIELLGKAERAEAAQDPEAMQEAVLALEEASGRRMEQWRNRIGRWIEMPPPVALDELGTRPALGFGPSLRLGPNGELVKLAEPHARTGRRIDTDEPTPGRRTGARLVKRVHERKRRGKLDLGEAWSDLSAEERIAIAEARRTR